MNQKANSPKQLRAWRVSPLSCFDLFLKCTAPILAGAHESVVQGIRLIAVCKLARLNDLGEMLSTSADKVSLTSPVLIPA